MDTYRHDDVAFLIESNADSFHVTGRRLKEEQTCGAHASACGGGTSRGKTVFFDVQ